MWTLNLTSFLELSAYPGNHGNQTVFWLRHLPPSCAPLPVPHGAADILSGSWEQPPVAGGHRGQCLGSGRSRCYRNDPLAVHRELLDRGQSLQRKKHNWKWISGVGREIPNKFWELCKFNAISSKIIRLQPILHKCGKKTILSFKVIISFKTQIWVWIRNPNDRHWQTIWFFLRHRIRIMMSLLYKIIAGEIFISLL